MSQSFEGETKNFCCSGCRKVYEILKANNLDDFYSFKDKSLSSPINLKSESFNYLDSGEFVDEFVTINNGEQSFRFYIEGIHCTACLWLLERLPKIEPGITYSKINMGTNTLAVNFKGIKLSRVANLIQYLGYKPHPILTDQQEYRFMLKEDQKDLIRIGVAFACAGNIMLYSLAVYAGADPNFSKYFNFFSFICVIPVLFYSAIPLYCSAYSSIRSKNLSIDIPITIAIFAGFCMGVVGLVLNLDIIYFDTLAILVFLLSLSRFILKKIQQKTVHSQNLLNVFQTQTATRVLATGDEEEVLIKFLEVGDVVIVRAGEIVPADGTVIEGKSSINNSILTGESLPEDTIIGSSVYTGSENITSTIKILVNKKHNESRIAQIINELKVDGESTTTSQFARRLAKNFVYISLILSIVFFVYFLIVESLPVALERSLTLLVITCPCALGLTIPLAFIMGISTFMKEGIFIKGESTFENLVKAKKIFLDKTGTLTTGNFVVLSELSKLRNEELNILFSLERKSHHPIAQSIVRECERLGAESIEIVEYKEVAGVGVHGIYGGCRYSVKAKMDSPLIANTNLVTVVFERDNLEIMEIRLRDEIRKEAKGVISYFRSLGLTPSILTGDTLKNATYVGEKLNLSKDLIYAGMSPEDKNDIVKKSENSIMVGDGINDAMALKNAYVGIAVSGSANISLQASDIYMSKKGIEFLHKLVSGTRQVMYLIYFNIFLSLLYNIVGVYITFIGFATPLIAAILMPLSSLTVLSITLVFFLRLRRTLRNR